MAETEDQSTQRGLRDGADDAMLSQAGVSPQADGSHHDGTTEEPIPHEPRVSVSLEPEDPTESSHAITLTCSPHNDSHAKPWPNIIAKGFEHWTAKEESRHVSTATTSCDVSADLSANLVNRKADPSESTEDKDPEWLREFDPEIVGLFRQYVKFGE
jgi:hypothetical protein